LLLLLLLVVVPTTRCFEATPKDEGGPSTPSPSQIYSSDGAETGEEATGSLLSPSQSENTRLAYAKSSFYCDKTNVSCSANSYMESMMCRFETLIPEVIHCKKKRNNNEGGREEEKEEQQQDIGHRSHHGKRLVNGIREGYEQEDSEWECEINDMKWIYSVHLDAQRGKCRVDMSLEYYAIFIVGVILFGCCIVMLVFCVHCLPAVAFNMYHTTSNNVQIHNIFYPGSDNSKVEIKIIPSADLTEGKKKRRKSNEFEEVAKEEDQEVDQGFCGSIAFLDGFSGLLFHGCSSRKIGMNSFLILLYKIKKFSILQKTPLLSSFTFFSFSFFKKKIWNKPRATR
jgi:hypothetical protein